MTKITKRLVRPRRVPAVDYLGHLSSPLGDLCFPEGVQPAPPIPQPLELLYVVLHQLQGFVVDGDGAELGTR
jgi:hypothetical protein